MSNKYTQNPPKEKIHFIWKAEDPKVSAYSKKLIKSLGQTPYEDSTMIVSVGGDGTLLEAFHKAGGRKVYGLTAPASSSKGFWTDHCVRTDQDLLKRIKKAEEFLLSPLKAIIRFSKGCTEEIFGYNDIAVKAATGQTIKTYLSVQFKKNKKGPIRIQGDGICISTAFGSTGTNLPYFGPAVTIPNQVSILTVVGSYSPRITNSVVINNSEASFHIDIETEGTKRPVRIDYDGHSIFGSEEKGQIVGIDISGTSEKSVRCLMQPDPGLRAISALIPS